MKKNNHFEILNEIKSLTDKIRSIDEAISYEDEYDEPEVAPQGEEMSAEEPEVAPEGEEGMDCEGGMCMDAETDVDRIREIALKGMVKLCHEPESEVYQSLKKIFTFCEKAIESKDNNVQQVK